MSAYRGLKSALRRNFVDLLVRRMNGTDAIRKLKPQCKRPDVLAAKWRAKPEIKAAIDERLQQAMEEAGITNAQILLSIARIANLSVKDLAHPDGRAKKIHELSDDVACLIQGVEVDADGTVKYRLASRLEASKLLGQYRKLFTQSVDVNGRVTLEGLVGASQQEGSGE